MNDNLVAKKQFNKIGIVYIIGTLFAIGIQYAAIGLVNIGALGTGFVEKYNNDGNIQLLVVYLPLMIIAYPLFILLITKSSSGTKITEHKMSVGKLIIAFVMTYALTYICNLVGALITGVVGAVKGSPVENPLLSTIMATNVIVEFIIMVIAAPIFEELIFRKLLIDRIVKYGEGIAIVVSGLLFALFHGNISQAVYAFTLGSFFAFIYVRTGRIRYTMIIHATMNFIGSVLAGSVLKLLDINKIASYLSSGDMDAYMQYVMDNATALMMVGLYFIAIFAMVIVGIIFWIVFRKKFFLEPVENAIPKGERFKNVFANPGMIIYIVIWGVFTIVQLFS